MKILKAIGLVLLVVLIWELLQQLFGTGLAATVNQSAYSIGDTIVEAVKYLIGYGLLLAVLAMVIVALLWVSKAIRRNKQVMSSDTTDQNRGHSLWTRLKHNIQTSS